MTGPRRLSALLAGAGVRAIDPVASDPEVTGVTIDSRLVLPGRVFLALRGLRADGATFAAEAVLRGAVAVVASSPRPADLPDAVVWIRVTDARAAAGRLAREWHGRPDEGLTLVGITGTNGKTTVAYLVESIATAAGRSAGRIGTVGYAHSGREVPASRTTPEAPDLFALLSEMRDAGVSIAALEVSSHALALGRTEGARFAAAAFLNLGRDHLDFHGDVASYFEAKARLFDGLDPDAVAVLAADDPRSDALRARTRARVTTFGRSPSADVRLVDETCGLDGSSAVLVAGKNRLAVRTPLPGRYNLLNVAAAAACAIGVGLPARAIAEGVLALRRIPGRMDRVDAGQPFSVIVDFAHTEQALERLLEAVAEIARGRTLLVFGCGGERDRSKRPAMGRVAAEGADLVFLTSDNPRGEDAVEILREVEAGIGAADGCDRVRTIPDRADAVTAAIAAARPGDAVVIAGKGHEATQSIGARVIRLDDRDLACEALAALGWTGGCRAHV